MTMIKIALFMFLSVHVFAQNHFRITDPQALSGGGNGWSVNPRTGALQMVIPVAVVPGEVQIPVRLKVNAHFSSQKTQYYYKDIDTARWTPDYSAAINRPVYGTQNFGFIAEAANYNGVATSKTYVLETGAQFVQEELIQYTSWVSDLSPTPTTFALPQSFGLLAIGTGPVLITGDGRVATYTAVLSDLGNWGSRISGLTSSGYTKPNPNTYQVIIDKDRARVYQYYSEFSAWVPVFWVDRYNHWVAFQWTRKTTSLPSGVSAIHTVEAKNQRGKGIRLEWAQFSQPFPATEQDLLRADMINVDAPSILVKGYAGWSTDKPTGFNQALADYESYVVLGLPGPVGRPTSIKVGSAFMVPAPSWQGSASYPIVYPPSETTAPLLQWTITYDAAKASITAFSEPNGTITSFSRYATYGLTPSVGGYASGRTDPMNSWAVEETASTDPSGQVLRRDWSRTTSAANEPVVMTREVFGQLAGAQRKTELTYASPAEAPHFGNGALKQIRLLDTAGAQWAKTVFTLTAAGLDGSYSTWSGQVVERLGEQRRTYARLLATQNLQTTKVTTFIGTSNLKVQEEVTTFETKKALLDIQRPLSTQVTRFNADGTVLLPTGLSGVDYDAMGRVIQSYQNGGVLGKVGQSISYDSDGRASSESPYHSLFPAVSARTFTYDSATGNITNTRLSWQAASQGNSIPTPSIWVDQSQGDFDNFGRARTITDERGVSTSATFDVRGRLVNSQRQGEGAVTYGYPDELTRTVTQNGLTTTEKHDGFGRMMSVSAPDGTIRSIGYDIHGRPNASRVQTPTSLSAPDSRTFDPLDRPISHTSTSGSVETWGYSSSGVLEVTTRTLDATGVNAISVQYRDAFGQVTQSVAPTGITTWASYDGLGNILQIKQTPTAGAPAQYRTFTYDALGRLTAKTEPETGTTTFTGFNAFGLPTTVTQDKGPDGLNRTLTLAWDNLGRLTKQSAATGEYISYMYDGLIVSGQETQNADGTVVSQQFEYLGGAGKRLSTERTTMGGIPAVIQYTYDQGTGRLTAVTYPSGRITGYGYDALGRVNSITANGQSVVNSVSFNQWGQRQRVSFASGSYSDWSTKNAGTQLDQWVIGFTQGGLSDPGTPRRYSYDSAERLTQAGEWSLVHDKEDRVITSSAPVLGIASDFDHDAYGNNIKSISTGSATSQINNFNFPAQLGNQIPALTSAGQATGWTYAIRGEASRISRLANGSYQGIGWDGLGRLSTVTEGGQATKSTYGPSGMRTAMTVVGNPVQSRRYVYSSSGQLLSEASQETFTAHGGNKGFRVGHSPNEFSAIYNSIGRFQGGEVVTATVWFLAPSGVHGEMFLGDPGGADPYDNWTSTAVVGNGAWQKITLTRTMSHDDDMWVYLYSDQWSVADNTKVPAHPGTIYDDLLVTGSVRGTVLNEGFEGSWPFGNWGSGVTSIGPVATGEPNPLAWKRDVIYLGAEAIAEMDAFGVHELHNDHLGTPRIITRGSNGTIEGRQSFAAFGERVLSEGYLPLTGFTGHVQNDPTGLIYMRGRYFSPAWHAFLNSDQGVDPLSLNQRAYVGGGAFSRTDPTGLEVLIDEGDEGEEDDGGSSHRVPGGTIGRINGVYIICNNPAGCSTTSLDGWVPYGSGTGPTITSDGGTVDPGVLWAWQPPTLILADGGSGGGYASPVPPAVPQPPKRSKAGCLTACFADAALRGVVGGLASSTPLTAGLYAAADIGTGGINLFSGAAGYSGFTGGSSGTPGVATLGTTVTALSIGHQTGDLANVARKVYQSGAWGASTRAGVALKGLGKYLPGIGIAVAAVQAVADGKGCLDRCSKENGYE